MNTAAIDEISKSGSSLIITVDTGITAIAETVMLPDSVLI